MRRNKFTTLIFLIVFGTCSLFMSGCATSHTIQTSQEKPGEQTNSNEPPAWLDRLNDENVMLLDSEFSIFFPQENAPAISTLSVVAHGNLEIKAWAHSKKRSVREASLSSSQFLELIHDLRSFKYGDFAREDLARCETYALKVRIQSNEVKFVGCRMASHNASVISRLAHKTQFYLLAAGKSSGPSSGNSSQR